MASLALALALLAPTARSAEGMWLPEQLPELEADLQELGLDLPVDQLADPLGQPLGAVVSLGGCTASFVSPQGLAITNHHCVQRLLQVNSTAERNYARDGVVAASLEEELPGGSAARMWVVTGMEEVTEEVLGSVPRRVSDAERAERIARARKALVAECESVSDDVRCAVSSFHAGRSYRLVRSRVIRDVRLAYVPPASVGNYGDEVDNWMWPRHAGDFALLRAYVAPDGSAASYAADNIPYRPPHHLRVQPAGVEEGELLLVAGFPGSTDRHAPAWQLQHTVEERYPRQIESAEQVLALLRALAAEDAEAEAKLTAPIGWIGNGLKYRQGILDAVEATDALAPRRAQLESLEGWIAEDRRRARSYGRAVQELRELDAAAETTWWRDQLAANLLRYLDLLSVAHIAVRFATEADKPDLERDAGFQERDRAPTRARFEQLEDSLYLPADRALARWLLERIEELPAARRLPAVDAWLAEQGGVEAALERLFDEPELARTEARLALLEEDLDGLRAARDPWVELALRLEEQLYAPQRERGRARSGARRRLEPVYMEALLEQLEGPVYPDANGTLRVSYGVVKGSRPADGLAYLPFTTTAGMAAKAGDWPFAAPGFLLDAVPSAPGSPYAHPGLGDVPVDFLSTLDTTGGNSGSPCLNARGELVGLLFDGTYESIIADWVFQPEITRSIQVDIRYALWVMEQHGAERVLSELLQAAAVD